MMIFSAVPGRTRVFPLIRSHKPDLPLLRQSQAFGFAPEWALGQFPVPQEKAPLGLLVLIRGAIYNPLCKLVWIARTFVLAYIHGFLPGMG
jgi:hypothetical protein